MLRGDAVPFKQSNSLPPLSKTRSPQILIFRHTLSFCLSMISLLSFCVTQLPYTALQRPLRPDSRPFVQTARSHVDTLLAHSDSTLITMEQLVDKAMGKILGHVQVMGQNIASQSSSIETLSGRVQAMQGEIGVVGARVESMQGEMASQKEEMKGGLADLDSKIDSNKTDFVDVVRFATEKRARVDEQSRQQHLFLHVMHLVASVGFIADVKAVFSLNKSTWNDWRLWNLIIDKKYKHTETEREKKEKEEGEESSNRCRQV